MSNKSTFNVRIRRVASTGARRAQASGNSGGGAGIGGGVSASAFATLSAAVERLAAMWLEDPERPGTIYTPGSAYAIGGISALGYSPALPDAAPGDSAGEAMELYTSWTDKDPEGKALAAALGIELLASIQAAERSAAAAIAAAARARAQRCVRYLHRGVYPLNAEQGIVYRNVGYALMRMPRRACTFTLCLRDYMPAAMAAEERVSVVGVHKDNTAAPGVYAVPAAMASLERDAATDTLRVRIHQLPANAAGLPAALSLKVEWDTQARYIHRNTAGRLVLSDDTAPSAQPMPPAPTWDELENAFQTADFKGLEVQRRRRVAHSSTRGGKVVRVKCHKWVHPVRIRRNPMGVYRVRRRSSRGNTGRWIYISAAHGNIKILG